MAQLLHLKIETDLIHDAFRDLEMVNRALVKCHGLPFRKLQRRIDDLIEGEIEIGKVDVHWLDAATGVMEPPSELRSILQEARSLGVIG